MVIECQFPYCPYKGLWASHGITPRHAHIHVAAVALGNVETLWPFAQQNCFIIVKKVGQLLNDFRQNNITCSLRNWDQARK